MNKYKLLKEEYIEEVFSTVKLYEHIKTKAQVLCLSNHDENKAFGIGFKTIPTDSTGVAHIVEHCVLSGSRKYKTKEPFMDLIKSSMQTFLNAMTFPDKTIYPVSSRNLKDFYNLMDVYLDAVFYPLIYDKKEIFLQEGWHYELENKEDDISYNGVVYNEMKGVYSDPANIVADAISFNLHENSSYGVDSGGDPKEIPNLSYENFLKFHKKFYHPSNSYIYLYGDLDMDKALEYIDKEYLNNFEYSPLKEDIILNEEFKKAKEVSKSYALSKEEYSENKDYLAMGWCLGKSDNSKDLFMRNFLSELLIDSDSAPLKRALLDKNIAEDVYAEVSSSLALDMSIIAKNTSVKLKEEFEKTIKETLLNIVNNGIDKDLLTATLNKFEFSFREGGGTQKAIIYYIRSLNTWLYNASAFDGLKSNDLIRELRSKIDTDYFENYIKEKLLDNNYRILVQIKADTDKKDLETKENKKKLDQFKKSLSEEELDNLIKETKSLFEFQLTEDSKEDKKTIPSLELSDIKKGISHIDRVVYNTDYGKFLYNKANTNSISYITISFSSEHIGKEDIFNMSIGSDLLSKLSTENYHYNKLDTEIYKTMGGLSINPSSYKIFGTDDFKRRVNLSFKALDVNLEKSLDLIYEIITKTLFNDKNRIKELLLISKSLAENAIIQNGHNISVETLKSYYSPQGAYNAKISGLENYFYLSELLKDFDNKFNDFKESIEKIIKTIFNSLDVVVNYTGDEKDLESKKSLINDFLNKLPKEEYEKSQFSFKEEGKNIGYTTSANVNFVAKGYDLKKLDKSYNGSMSVLSNILSADYLHNNIRAKGGAYGAGMRISVTSELSCFSYRDPNLLKTIEVYDNMDKFIENLNLEEDELKNYIIGTMNAFDPLLSEPARGDVNFSRYMSNIDEETLSKYKDEALSTNLEKLKSLSKTIKEAMDKNYICVIGSENSIKENKDLFNKIENLKR